jgi:hypothetical protein
MATDLYALPVVTGAAPPRMAEPTAGNPVAASLSSLGDLL